MKIWEGIFYQNHSGNAESSIALQFVGSIRSLHFPAVHIRGHCLQQIQPTFKHNTIHLLLLLVRVVAGITRNIAAKTAAAIF